jgi:hypothetical protein
MTEGSSRMTALSAWRDGMRRVNRAPAVLAGVWLTTLLVGAPLALVLRGMLAQHLGDSLVANTAAVGANYDWMQEFAGQASGVGVTFRPTIIGAGAVLDNASAFADNVARPIVIVGAASAYIALWIFLAGGILDRFARDRATRAFGFFAAAGGFFPRFLRLAIGQWIVYAALFGWLHPYLFNRLFQRLTHDMAVERDAFTVRLGLYLVFGLIVAACAIVFDYAKVRAVVEDRRSMIGAIGSAVRFVRRNPAAVPVFALNVLMFVGCLTLYALVAPGARGSGVAVWWAFGLGQIYILARLWVKLTFWASETALFQARLAHAGYVARPEAVWPDSPAAEAITPLVK